MTYADADTLTTALEHAAGVLPWRIRSEVVADLVDHEPPDDLAEYVADAWRRAVGLSRLPRRTQATIEATVRSWQRAQQAVDHGPQLMLLGGAA